MALAAEPRWENALAGRLRQIKETGVVRLGYHERAIPFSCVGAEGRPVGCTLDLCRAIVATIAADLGRSELGIDYVRVTPQDRMAQVVDGAVDLECGATTNTAERRRQVAFSPVIFVTGTRLAVPRGSRVRDPNDLRGRPVAVVSGTTNEAAMREYDRLNGLAIRFVAADDYRAALTLLTTGGEDALAADGHTAARTACADRAVDGVSSRRRHAVVRALRDPCMRAATAPSPTRSSAARPRRKPGDRLALRPLVRATFAVGRAHRTADGHATAPLAGAARAAGGVTRVSPC
ncbi:MAG: amino acid ABC transporter substrate-binding protein [Betaproteobacteria bacterium]|nr:amino acid ABC transporter substrate-binding protein [Betaproteobacteria bacterium]